jgi:uroporphyrinogen decarboxylase
MHSKRRLNRRLEQALGGTGRPCDRLEELAATGTEGVGVNWTVSLGGARRRTSGKVAIQGNLDPVTLCASPAALRAEVARTKASHAAGGDGTNTGHVFNLGHGMSPNMDPEQVQVLVEAAHEAMTS